MCATTDFKKVTLDIVSVLNSPAVVGEYRGKEAWAEINNLINKESDGTLVLIDIRRANPLQYLFCQYAFGPLFQLLEDKIFQHKYVIFQMYDFHQPGFFRGVLKCLGTDLPRKESMDGFVSADKYAKLIIGDEVDIKFIGKPNTNEAVILDVVNKLTEVTVRKVVEETGLSEEIIVDTLRALVQKYFIVEPVGKPGSLPRYYSFYKYFRKENVCQGIPKI